MGELIVLANNLTTGLSKSCGRSKRDKPEDFDYRRFKPYPASPMLCPWDWYPAGGEFDFKRGLWVCTCRYCRKFTRATDLELRTGRRKHCGCRTSKVRRTDLFKRTRQQWRDMKRRCDDPSHKSYKDYGGRGIVYDPVWRDFAVFLAQMKECPDGLQLDRVRVHGHYTMSNCEYKTPKENSNNRRPRNSKDHSPVEKVPWEVMEPPREKYPPLPMGPDGIRVPYVSVPYGSDGIFI